MTYQAQAQMAEDRDLLNRITACAYQEGVPDAQGWAFNNAWSFASQPGWGSAYDSALTNGVSQPGIRGHVISDHMILAAVQSLYTEREPEEA